MHTIGIDLASQPPKTGICVIEWSDGGATVKHVAVNQDDAAILAAAAQWGFPATAAIGIDCPLGWPVTFRAFLDAAYPGPGVTPALPPRSDKWRLRETDRYVKLKTGITPLAVAMDKIASVAVRCMYLQEQLKISDRCGGKSFYEVYPRASLHRCGLPKPDKTVGVGPTLAAIELTLPTLSVPVDARKLILKEKDAFDAFVAALTARAATCGLVDPIPKASKKAADQEGWIHLPAGGALSKLTAMC